MSDARDQETAALVALLRGGRRPWQRYAELVEEARSATALLEEEQGLLAPEQLEAALAEIDRWREQRFHLLTVLDDGYPDNLRAVHDRPPLIFVAGALTSDDARAVAVVGSRAASNAGVARARAIAGELVKHDYAVVSGLAAGIDTAAHTATMKAGGRTIAVIGTGLARVYPQQNERLQDLIAQRGAVVSQFWPDVAPSRRNFPMRNAVISGLSLATVVVEASETGGSRLQARLALEQGRPVLLVDSMLELPWARELATRPGTHVVHAADQVTEIVERLTAPGALTA